MGEGGREESNEHSPGGEGKLVYICLQAWSSSLQYKWLQTLILKLYVYMFAIVVRNEVVWKCGFRHKVKHICKDGYQDCISRKLAHRHFKHVCNCEG